MTTKQTTYKATFSNGETVTRTSAHGYKTAGRWINRNTNEGKGGTFSANEAKPVISDIACPAFRYATTAQERKQIKREQAEALKVWRWEVVKVEVIA